jgi:hypothetical protein
VCTVGSDVERASVSEVGNVLAAVQVIVRSTSIQGYKAYAYSGSDAIYEEIIDRKMYMLKRSYKLMGEQS